MDALLGPLDLGEAEAIILGQELNADLVLMDERKGRRELAERNLNKIGTVGILLRAKLSGLIDELAPELDKLARWQFWISPTIIDSVLEQAGEK